MRRLVRMILRWRRGVLCLVVMCTLVACLGMARLQFDPSNAHLFHRRGGTSQVYAQFVSLFGSDESLLVALHDPQQTLLTTNGMEALHQLHEALLAIPHVAAVHSLITAPDMARLRLTPFGLAVPRLITDDNISAEQRAAVQHNSQIIGTFLAPDFHTAGLLVVPEASMPEVSMSQSWLTAVRQVAAQHARNGRSTYVAGTPLERSEVTRYLQRDQRLIVPLVLAVLVSIAYGIYRSKRLVILTLISVMLPLLWTLGIVGFSGLRLNVITSLLPAIILVVSVSVVIHLLNQFLRAVIAGHLSAEAIEEAFHQVGLSCGFSALTTAIGFFSLVVSPIPAIQEFAVFAALGVLLAFLAALTCVPIGLFWVGTIPQTALMSFDTTWSLPLLQILTGWATRHRRLVFLGCALLLLLALPGIGYVQEGTDIIRALKATAPLRQSSEFIDQHLTGVNSLELIVSLPASKGPVTPATLRRILAFSQWLRTQAHVTAVFSPWEPLRDAPADLLTDDTKLSVLATLLPLSLPLEAWLSVQPHVARLSARVTAIHSNRFLELVDAVQQQAERMSLPVQITGRTYLLATMSRTLVRTQMLSMLMAVGLILGSITLLLRSWRLGLVAAVPNLLPTLMIFGLMGWSGIALSTATMMIACVALGLIVDGTIHLLYRYQRERQTGARPLQAMDMTVQHLGPGVIFSACILALGFWVGLLGSFKPTIYFSFLTGLTMLFALLADLLVTPALALTTESET